MKQSKWYGMGMVARVSVDDKWVVIRGGTSNRGARALTSQVETVGLSPAGFGRSKVQLIGRGTVLGSFSVSRITAERIQKWLLEALDRQRAAAVPSVQPGPQA